MAFLETLLNFTFHFWPLDTKWILGDRWDQTGHWRTQKGHSVYCLPHPCSSLGICPGLTHCQCIMLRLRWCISQINGRGPWQRLGKDLAFPSLLHQLLVSRMALHGGGGLPLWGIQGWLQRAHGCPLAGWVTSLLDIGKAYRLWRCNCMVDTFHLILCVKLTQTFIRSFDDPRDIWPGNWGINTIPLLCFYFCLCSL